MVRLSDLEGNAISGEGALTQHVLFRTSLPDGKPVFVETMPPKYARQMTYSEAEFDKEYALNRGLYFVEPVEGRVGISTYSSMAGVYVRLGQSSGMTQEIIDQCTGWLSEVLRINPDDSGARLQRAFLLQQAGLAQDAREDYLHFIGLMGRYIQNEPGNDALYVMRGKAYFSIGERDKGMADLHKAQALNPRITIQE
jgi:tetratricopeptide (TPR) repeat protein